MPAECYPDAMLKVVSVVTLRHERTHPCLVAPTTAPARPLGVLANESTCCDCGLRDDYSPSSISDELLHSSYRGRRGTSPLPRSRRSRTRTPKSWACRTSSRARMLFDSAGRAIRAASEPPVFIRRHPLPRWIYLSNRQTTHGPCRCRQRPPCLDSSTPDLEIPVRHRRSRCRLVFGQIGDQRLRRQ